MYGSKEDQDKAIANRQDLHLVLEYNEGDQILEFVAPRSNRFYFVHDPNGGTMQQLEVYHELVKQKEDVTRHIFGGF
jgi:hypothetical protein